MKLIDYPGHNVQDITRMLRSIADRIDSGELRTPMQMICVSYAEGPQESEVDLFVLGGDLRPAMLLGVLELAKGEVLG